MNTLDGLVFIFRGDRVRILYDSKHAARVALGVAHARRNIALAHKCNELGRNANFKSRSLNF